MKVAAVVGIFVSLAGVLHGEQPPTIRKPIRFASSRPMYEAPQASGTEVKTRIPLREVIRNFGDGTEDAALQTAFGPLLDGTPGISFEGISAPANPSDVNLAVGPNHIVQIINTDWAVFDKTGQIYPGFPKTLGSIWSELGDACANEQGDPIAQYDRLADRWLLSQIGSVKVPYTVCIAVSNSGDPTGAYSLYEYSFGDNFPDYPHFSVWPTASNPAYLQMANLYYHLQTLVGTAACAYDRNAMLAGASSAVQVCFTIAKDTGYQPSDLDGAPPPPDGSPGYFITIESRKSLREYQLGPNFAQPDSSTLNGPIDIPVAIFGQLCGGGTCVPQTGTNQELDSLADRMMHRLAYRNFGDHESLVVNHSVGGGPRWYEIRSPLSPSIYQQGTFAPDLNFRWMGSIAMDQAGDMLMSYSTSSRSIHPGIAYTGRVPGDALDTMESENVLVNGSGSEVGSSRWGDYSAMRIDPADDCTFWLTNQYLKNDGILWSTEIGSFTFSGCSASPSFTLSADPSSLSIGQGNSGSSVVTVNPMNGFNGSVNLSTSGVPNGVTANFNPNPTNTSSTLNLIVSTAASVGSSTITVGGVSGGQTASTAVTLTVTGSGPVVRVTPTSLSWGKVLVGKTGAAKTVTVQNTGGSTLSFTSIAVSGDFAREAGPKKTDCGSTLAANATCTVRVVFSPTMKGTRTGILSFTDNAPGSPQNVALSGTGK